MPISIENLRAGLNKIGLWAQNWLLGFGPARKSKLILNSPASFFMCVSSYVWYVNVVITVNIYIEGMSNTEIKGNLVISCSCKCGKYCYYNKFSLKHL